GLARPSDEGPGATRAGARAAAHGGNARAVSVEARRAVLSTVHSRASGNPGPQAVVLGPRFRGDERRGTRVNGRRDRYGLRPISITMTLGRPSICGPADAETPAMMPSAISARASACAIGASSLARPPPPHPGTPASRPP